MCNKLPSMSVRRKSGNLYWWLSKIYFIVGNVLVGQKMIGFVLSRNTDVFSSCYVIRLRGTRNCKYIYTKV